MKNLVPGAIFNDIPILPSEDVPECPGCGGNHTFVVQAEQGPSMAGCLVCGKQWKIARLLDTVDPPLTAEDFWRDVGRRVQGVRKRFGVTQATLADAINVSRTSVVNLESGRQQMGLYKLYKAACLLGCRLREIIPDDSTEEVDEGTD